MQKETIEVVVVSAFYFNREVLEEGTRATLPKHFGQEMIASQKAKIAPPLESEAATEKPAPAAAQAAADASAPTARSQRR